MGMKTNSELLEEINALQQRLAELQAGDKKAHHDNETLSKANEIIKRSPVVAFLWKNEKDWPVAFVTENVKPLFGYDVQDFLQGRKTYADIIHKEDLERVELEVTEAGSDEGRQSFTHKPYRILTKKGDIKWISDTTYIRRDPSGEINSYEGIVFDITDRKTIEDKVSSYISLLNTIMEQSPFAMWISDASGMLIKTNIALRKALRLSDEQILGKYNVLEDNNLVREGVMEQVKDVFNKLEPTRFVIRWSSTDVKKADFSGGSELWIDASLFPILDSEGNLKNVVCQWLDVTRLKLAEQELHRYSKQLENIVVERTRELQDAQEKILRQERLAVLGELAGSVGHELRNPLSVIINAVYFLREILSDEDVKVGDYLQMIDVEAQNASRIINDLLDFARIKSVERAPVSLAELVAEVLDKHPAPENVTIKTELAENLPQVFVDPQQIKQVIINLLSNAYQAVPERGQVIIKECELMEGGAKESHVAMCIQDTGTGILPENINKIFEPLYTTKAGGIGLGLTICKRLVEANDGKIGVKNRMGGGTVFTFMLPIYMNNE